MPCNAWNHPPYCECGWGGQGNPANLIPGYKGTRTTASTIEPQKPERFFHEYDFSYGSLTFPTFCWWCGGTVFFHHSENGGCVLFDRLGSPWPVHSCWEEQQRDHTKAAAKILERYRERLRSIRIEESDDINEAFKGEDSEGFILGCDFSCKILPNPDQLNNDLIHLHYIIIQLANGRKIRTLVPQYDVERIIKFSHVRTTLESYKRKSSGYVHFLRSIEKISGASWLEQKVSIDFDYYRFLNLSWTFQFVN